MLGSDFVVPRSARTRSFLLAGALLAALGMLALAAQAAVAGTPLNGGPAPLTGSTFQGADGDQRTPAPGDPDYVALPARTDWQTYASSPKLSTLPDGSGLQDTWFFQGKEQEPDKWTFQQRIVSPGKADVLGAWSLTDPVSSNVFLYLSFFRSAAGGTTFYNFELNQLTSTWTNSQGTVIPCRKNGDIIVSFELQGNAGDVGVRVWQWQSGSPGPAACPEGKVGTWTSTDFLSKDAMGNTIAQGAMNAGPIANYLDFNLDGDGDPSTNPSPASFDTADTFGEAALNLTKVLASLNSGDSCFNFGQLQLHTRSAEPFTADLKDFIAPKPIIARSCTIEGSKYHDLDADGTEDAGEPGLAGFRIYADTNNSGSFDAGEPNTFTADGTQPGKPLGSWVLDNLPAGDYEIREDLTNASGNPRATEGWTCSDPGISDPAPASATTSCRFDVSLAGGGVVGGLEFGNYKKALVRVEKQTVPDGAAGSFGFVSTLPGKASFSLSDGGVEETLVNPGVYTASETLHPDFNLTDITCTAGGRVIAPAVVQFDAKSGQTITCTYTNSRKTGELTVRKLLDPATDPGKFDLKIGDDLVVDDGGHLEQGTRTLPTGSGYTVSEDGGTGTSLSKYDSAVVCKDGDLTVASGSGTSLSGVPVLEGRNVVCTFTNERRPASIEVVKDLEPADDPGRFDLKVGDSVVKAGAGDGEGGSKSVAPGSYAVSEAGAGGTSLAKYDSAVSCDNGQSGDGSSLAVTVDSNDDVTCTITNTRREGQLTVVKELKPADDPGRFDLKVGDSVVKAGAGDGDEGSKSVPPGEYTVSELGAAGTNLAKYDSSIACDNGDSGDGASLAVTVDSNDDVTCTITNTRREGELTVVKALKPADDPGRFDLKVGDSVVKAGAGDGEGGSKSVAPGTYAVSEAGAGGSSLAKYDSAVSCDNGQSGDGSSLAVTVDSNDDITCTITNTRRNGSIKVIKQLVPSSDEGTFDLLVGDAVVKSDAGDGDFGTRTVAPGTYSASELAAAGTSLQDYESSVACDKNGQAYKDAAGTSIGGLSVDSDDAVVCTITNTRLGKVEIEKQTDPATDDSFHFSSNLPGGGFDLSDDGVRSVARVRPGSYGVTEDDPTPAYDLTGLACDDGQSQTPSTTSRPERTATIAVDPGETVRCVFTNSRRGNVLVVKTEGHGEPAEGHVWRFTLTGGPDQVDEQRETDGGSGPDQVAFGDLKAGTYTLCEVDLPEGWHSSLEQEPGAVVDPQTGDVCIEVTIANGETETIEVDNVRPDVELEKTVRRTPGGSFAKDAKAHVGDTLEYRFRVTNPGVGELSVALEELEPDRCDEGTLTEPEGDSDDDGTLDPGEQWDYFCTHEITADDPDPLPNTAKATGTDEYGNTDKDESSAEVDVLHPDIEVDKGVDRQSAHVGDKLAYTFIVTNEGDAPLVVEFRDPRCDAGTLTGPAGDGDGDGRLDVDKTWTYGCSHVVVEQDPSPLPNTATVTGTDELGGTDEDADSTSVVIVRSGALVVKEGNQFAYPGDTVSFTFAVTNTGNAPLSDVTVTDDRCAPVTRSSGDERLDPGETWTFMCSKQVAPGHKIGDENPIRNVATATGTDPLGRTVQSTDDHLVRVLHPAVEIDKSGPASALVGTALAYALAVTNPGDVPFARQDVVVTDPRCEAPPAGPNTGSDGTPAQLDPGDTWTYTCTAQTAGQPAGTFVNTATVTARDFNGRQVNDTDEFPTMLETQQVLPQSEIVSGTARLRGASGCVRGPFTATVRGRRIARVTFYRDGKRIKTITAKPAQRRFTVKVKPSDRRGVHTVTARVQFRTASQTRARTLRLSYQRCRKQVVIPRFTG